ncbi:MAG: hypothetical protein IPK12_24440 [Gemmatimonadetes bacterium]|nr:hypothetical protein [Gemmatimonadota bacterium]
MLAFFAVDYLIGGRILNEQYFVAFLLASLGWGTLVNVTFAVLVGTWRFRYGLADRLPSSLLPFDRKRDVLILLPATPCSNSSRARSRSTGGSAGWWMRGEEEQVGEDLRGRDSRSTRRHNVRRETAKIPRPHRGGRRGHRPPPR